MKSRLEKLLPVRTGEWHLVLSLSLVLAINTLVLELSDAVATSGFVSDAGPGQLPWLWAVDMMATLVLTGAFAMVIDKMPRLQLVSWLFGALAVLYLIILMLFSYGAPAWLNYFLLYILSDQQFIIFPLAFWALASDIYSLSESKRLFPVIGAGFAIGSIAGNGLAAGSAVLFARLGRSAADLLIVGAIAFLIGLALLQVTFRNRSPRARQSRASEAGIRDTFEVARDFFANVPLFRFLAIAMLLTGLALTLIEFHFILSIDQAFSDSLQFQAFYGAYKAVLIITMLVLQWLVVSRILKRAALRDTFLVLPATLLAASVGSLAAVGLAGAAGGRFLARLVLQAWDEPARKSVENLVPDERRGRISAFLDSYLFAVATLVGCLVLGILIVLTKLDILTENTMAVVYLSIAALCALGAIWSAWRLRGEYDGSLLNWRLTRSRRKSMLDGIEF